MVAFFKDNSALVRDLLLCVQIKRPTFIGYDRQIVVDRNSNTKYGQAGETQTTFTGIGVPTHNEVLSVTNEELFSLSV